MPRALLAPFRRFARDTSGNMVIELLLMLPLFLWVLLGIITYFYGFHMKTIGLKGAYTVSDLLSREMEGPVTPAYIEGLDGIFNYVTNTADPLGRLRVTVITCTDKCDKDDTGRELDIDWSYGTNGLTPMTKTDLNTIFEASIPLLPAHDRVILVETQVLYRSPVSPIWFGVGDTQMESFVVTRPRFVPKLEWENS
ncbi:hypothetical protein NHN26_13560 [Rhodovulum tesquicola]|uniref:TadE/TadG family type IV pilus assembly protein n=1 Tax=Rhodovulum tesquicola TaxID=540254 RepID=UPI002096858E|nr:hypothetical protein [Rhodovulum tesquicola]MCO8146249.1 hypothetical protein [Rhodovulum tesquicola]